MDAGNWVTPVRPLATPLGPSDRVIAGMHREGIAELVFSTGWRVARTTKEAFCDNVIFDSTSPASLAGVAEW